MSLGRGNLQVDASPEDGGSGWCRVLSQNVRAEDGEGIGDVSFRADESLMPGEPEWANYVKGVVKEFMTKVCGD